MITAEVRTNNSSIKKSNPKRIRGIVLSLFWTVLLIKSTSVTLSNVYSWILETPSLDNYSFFSNPSPHSNIKFFPYSNRNFGLGFGKMENEHSFLLSKLFKKSDFRNQYFKNLSNYIAFDDSHYNNIPKGWPTLGQTTSKFGFRVSPIHRRIKFHSGVDIANSKGTAIKSTADGVIKFARWMGGYGHLVIINHGSGYETYYGHNSDIIVRKGERVKAGQIIAFMGSSGSSTGSHLHYEVWYKGNCLDPWGYLTSGESDDEESPVKTVQYHDSFLNPNL